MISLAQAATGVPAAQAYVARINDVILFPLIILLLTIALVIFLIGLFEYAAGANNQTARAKGARHILIGLIGLLIMLSAYAILSIAAGTFGIDTSGRAQFSDLNNVAVSPTPTPRPTAVLPDGTPPTATNPAAAPVTAVAGRVLCSYRDACFGADEDLKARGVVGNVFAAEVNSPINSLGSGEVRTIFGSDVIVEHDDGTLATYSGVNPTVSDGQRIERGTPIGSVVAGSNYEGSGITLPTNESAVYVQLEPANIDIGTEFFFLRYEDYERDGTITPLDINLQPVGPLRTF